MIVCTIYDLIFYALIAKFMQYAWPDDYRYGIGGTVYIVAQIVWVAIWIIVFPVLGHRFTFS